MPKSSSANDGCDKDKETLMRMNKRKIKGKKNKRTDEISRSFRSFPPAKFFFLTDLSFWFFDR